MTVEVSRQDIISDKIVEVQAANKFLKVPADSYLEMLGISPLPSQMAMTEMRLVWIVKVES